MSLRDGEVPAFEVMIRDTIPGAAARPYSRLVRAWSVGQVVVILTAEGSFAVPWREVLSINPTEPPADPGPERLAGGRR